MSSCKQRLPVLLCTVRVEQRAGVGGHPGNKTTFSSAPCGRLAHLACSWEAVVVQPQDAGLQHRLDHVAGRRQRLLRRCRDGALGGLLRACVRNIHA